MILRKIFNPIAVLRYMRIELMLATIFSVLLFFLHQYEYLDKLSLPFSIVAILGSALAIFLAFRNNNSYNRWWEARTVWGSIMGNSRIFARQIIANADNAIAIGKVQSEVATAYKKELIYRQIAFAHALRLHLRSQDTWAELALFLPEKEFAMLSHKTNKPNYILHCQGLRIKEGLRAEFLGAFDNISLEPTLAACNQAQAACERIKNTPLLRQYHFFTKLFLWVFMILLPFSLIADFSKMGLPLLVIPISILVSFVFAVMAKVGEVNEDPFENKITDIPMLSMSNNIERDLKEMLGETTLPEQILAKNGFLF